MAGVSTVWLEFWQMTFFFKNQLLFWYSFRNVWGVFSKFWIFKTNFPYFANTYSSHIDFWELFASRKEYFLTVITPLLLSLLIHYKVKTVSKRSFFIIYTYLYYDDNSKYSLTLFQTIINNLRTILFPIQPKYQWKSWFLFLFLLKSAHCSTDFNIFEIFQGSFVVGNNNSSPNRLKSGNLSLSDFRE